MTVQALQQLFSLYAVADGSAKARRTSKTAASTMNVLECHALCEAVGLYTSEEGREFTTRENLVAFVKVNLDDDLYYQARAWYVHMQRVRSVRIMAHGVHMDCT